MQEIIREIQADNFTHFDSLHKQFIPLVYSWLYKIRASQNDREDYMSQAKIILLESAKHYDFTRNVPFASYYKINLYNWYGNHMSKKKWDTLPYSFIEEGCLDNIEEGLLHEEQMNCILNLKRVLTEQECIILKGLIKDKSTNEIAKEMGLSKKTILNKKYAMLSKIRKNLLPDPAAEQDRAKKDKERV